MGLIMGDGDLVRNGQRYTKIQRDVLELLEHQARLDSPFMPLEGVSVRVIRNLIIRDLITVSRAHLGLSDEYRITERGLRALAELREPRGGRTDGICPCCGIRPRDISKSGRMHNYCKPCLAAEANERYHRRGRKAKTKTPPLCPRCQQRRRHITASGNLLVYCLECANERQADRQVKLLQRLEGGEILLCKECGTRPRHYSARLVHPRCRECQRKQWHAWRKQYMVTKLNKKLSAILTRGKRT